jgi:hypothetical protein
VLRIGFFTHQKYLDDISSHFPESLEYLHLILISQRERTQKMTTKKRRGRPLGSGIDDSAELSQVADLLVRNPSMRPSAAMKQATRGRKGRETPETLLRRLQAKWKQQGESLLAAAQERARPKASSGAAGYSHYPLTATGQFRSQIDRMMDDQRRMQDLIDPPHLRMMREQQQRMQDLIDPPHLRMMREQQQRIQDLIDPPHMREFRRLEELQRQMRNPFGGW